MARQTETGISRLSLTAGLLCVAGIALAGCGEERPAVVLNPDVPYEDQAAPPAIVKVRVEEGDSVSQIAARCGASVEAIMYRNDLSDDREIYPGQILMVPSGHCDEYVAAVQPLPRPHPPRYARDARRVHAKHHLADHARDEGPNYEQAADRPDDSGSRPSTASSWWSWWTGASSAAGEDSSPDAHFIWPVQGRVIAGFGGSVNGVRNDGINIAAREGAPIHAAASGTVTYTGNELRGYGNLVLIRHANGFVTAYAHAQSIRVSRGDHVEKGEVIGTTGETGDVDSPQLHFEIRRGVEPVDPKRFLSERAS